MKRPGRCIVSCSLASQPTTLNQKLWEKVSVFVPFHDRQKLLCVGFLNCSDGTRFNWSSKRHLFCPFHDTKLDKNYQLEKWSHWTHGQDRKQQRKVKRSENAAGGQMTRFRDWITVLPLHLINFSWKKPSKKGREWERGDLNFTLINSR